MQTHLSEDYALVLQQVEEQGEEDIIGLAETLDLDRRRLRHIIAGLHNKGLLLVTFVGEEDVWVRLSTKGHRLFKRLWPEARSGLAG